MKLVWQLETCTVRQVYEALLESRAVAYTTVMTMMKILEEKKYLDKHQEGRAYVYQPTRPKVEVISGMVQEFVDRVFNGSIEPLVLSLMRDKKLGSIVKMKVLRGGETLDVQFPMPTKQPEVLGH